MRLNGKCVYCDGYPNTREHVPPKVFLDKPFPEELPVVEACSTCNSNFSLDEQYFACLLDCVISGSADPNSVQRETIKKTLLRKPSLAERLRNARKIVDGRIMFEVEYQRIANVVRKIAIGHVLHELNLLVRENEVKLNVAPFVCLNNAAWSGFENLEVGKLPIWPECGSRALQRIIISDKDYDEGWIHVQRSRYRYAVLQSEYIEVRMVFSEYLACVVRWMQ